MMRWRSTSPSRSTLENVATADPNLNFQPYAHHPQNLSVTAGRHGISAGLTVLTSFIGGLDNDHGFFGVGRGGGAVEHEATLG